MNSSAELVPNSAPGEQTSKHDVDPSIVGWQFVPQYYTFVNKQPGKLHCFYTKHSTFSHGTEGEDVTSCYGQFDINQKIVSIGFENCKVFIHNVDSQSSANNGIIVQVIGEMSNKGEPWRKFVQTFFLAEQPSGYYVLNDIFRFLKEESVEEEEEESQVAEGEVQAFIEEEPALQQIEAPAPPVSQHVEPAAPIAPVKLPTPAPSASPAPPAAATPAPQPAPPVLAAPPVTDEHPPATVQAVSKPAGQTNGHASPDKPVVEEEATEAPPAVVETAAAEVNVPPASPEASKVPAADSSLEVPAAQSKPATREPSPAPVPAAAAPAQPKAPAPAAPQKPRSWANMAATNPKGWTGTVAQEGRGISHAAPPPPAANNAPASVAAASGTATPPAPAASGGHPSAGRGRGGHGDRQHHLYIQAINYSTKAVFIKGVQETVSETALKSALINHFGPLDNLEVVRSKACAFGEFATVDAARKALVQSLPVHAGGEGGLDIPIAPGSGGVMGKDGRPTQRIVVEVKKERGERGERDRGGFQGGRGFGGRGGRGDGRGAPRGVGRGK